MVKAQRGLSIGGLIVILFIVVLVAIFGMKLVPSFIEYRAAKSAIDEIAAQNPSSPGEVRKAFYAHSTIDDITSIKPDDLEITKDGNGLAISFAYRKEIPLFRGVGLYINYSASTGGQ